MGVKLVHLVFNFYLISNFWYNINTASLTSNLFNNNNVKPKISSINGNCIKNSDCWIGSDNNRVCVDRKCQCKPNYSFDYINNQCKYFTCNLDKDCQSYDSHRICDAYDNCKCENNYGQDSITNKCILLRMIGSPCNQDSDCWTFEDSHRVCRENVCYCKQFYRFDYSLHKCLTKSVCDFDKDCQKYDSNRFCDQYGLCLCKPGFYANSINDKCKKISQTKYNQNKIDLEF